MLEIGSLVDGKYKILNRIGQGGMSVVYLAMNERANKQWAVKEVKKDGVQDFELVRQGLTAETDLLKKLHHPNLPSIVDVIDGEGTFLIVMDYVEGKTFARILEESGAQSQEEVTRWAEQLCDVLGYLHSRQPPVIYRDMKPSNIMLRPDGRVMLIDFGTAREFKEGGSGDTICLGTRGYAAPEQYGGRGQTDPRTDIYSLGATMYHLLTGHNPGEAPYELYPIRHWNRQLSSGLESIVLKCMQKNPRDRYQSCSALLYDLQHYRELDTEYRSRQERRWRMFLAAAFFALFAVAGAAGFWTAHRRLTLNTCERYLEEADYLSGTDPEQAMEYYENAIRLNPSSRTGYEAVLHFFLWQENQVIKESEDIHFCVFSQEEEKEMRRILGISGDSGKSNEEYLREQEEEYRKFAYELGLAYFYSFEGTGNKAASRKWLKIASQGKPSELLPGTKLARAKSLYQIACYYDSLGIRNQAGDSMVSYWDYWKDLTGVTGQASVDGTAVDLLLACRELTAQITAKAADFKQAGITREQMEDQMGICRKALEGLEILRESPSAEYETELKTEVTGNFALAEKTLRAVFNTGNLAEKQQGGEAYAGDTEAG